MEGSGGSVLLTTFLTCFQIEGAEISPHSFLLRRIFRPFQKTWHLRGLPKQIFGCQVPDYVYRVVEANTGETERLLLKVSRQNCRSWFVFAKSRSVESSIMIRRGFKDTNKYVKLHEDHWKEKGFEFCSEKVLEKMCAWVQLRRRWNVHVWESICRRKSNIHCWTFRNWHEISTFKNFRFFLALWFCGGPFMALSFCTFPSGDACGTSTWFRRDRWVDTRSSGCHSSTPGGSKRVTQNHPK